MLGLEDGPLQFCETSRRFAIEEVRVIRTKTFLAALLSLSWLAAQNVGIRTSSPITRLHIAAGDAFIGEVNGDNGFVFRSRAANNTISKDRASYS
jgi:hypothetical protein